jgi:hypothetical protein
MNEAFLDSIGVYTGTHLKTPFSDLTVGPLLSLLNAPDIRRNPAGVATMKPWNSN